LDSALQNSREEWRRFLGQSAPGHRFRNRYRRRQQAGGDRSTLGRACYVAFGIAIAIGSLVLAPFPGPGWVTFFVGLGMIAGEVLHVARFLDRAEVRARGALRLAKGMWDQMAFRGGVGHPDDLPRRGSVGLRSLPRTPNVLECANSSLRVTVD